MITKLASKYYSGADALNNNKDVKGYNSAKFKVVIPAGCDVTYGFYGTSDNTVATGNSQRLKVYYGTSLITTNINLTSPGVYEYSIDLRGITNIVIQRNINSEVSASSESLSLSQEIDIPLMSVEIQDFKSLITDVSKAIDVEKFNRGNIAVYHQTDSNVYSFMVYGTYSSGVEKELAVYNGEVGQIGPITLVSAGMFDFAINLENIVSMRISTNGEGSIMLGLSNSSFVKPQNPSRVEGSSKKLITKGINSIIFSTFLLDASGSPYILVRDSSSNKVSIDNGSVIYKNESAPLKEGYNELLIDTTNTDEITLIYNINTVSADIKASSNLVDTNKYANQGKFRWNNDCLYLDNDTKQVEFDVIGENNSAIYLEGSNDNFSTVSNIPMYIKTENSIITSRLDVTSSVKSVFANVEGFVKVRIRNYRNYEVNIKNCKCHKKYIEGNKITFCGSSYTSYQKLLKGYRYLKLNFLDTAIINGVQDNSSVINTSVFIDFRYYINNSYSAISPLTIKYYDRGMNRIHKDFLHHLYGLVLHGAPVGGGYIVELPETIGSDEVRIVPTKFHSLNNSSARVLYELECYANKPNAEEVYTKLYEHEDYEVYKLPTEITNRDVLNYDVLEWDDTSLTFYNFGYLGIKYNIPFNSDNVAHFLNGENIKFAYLLPMSAPYNEGARDGMVSSTFNWSRIVVFTNTRVFHNYPLRGNDNRPLSDLAFFDESTIYNYYEKRWQPVNDKNKADSTHKYLPVLKDYDYNQFNGRVTGTTGFVDTYGNGGLGQLGLLQDMLYEGKVFWNRLAYSSMTKGPKWCTFGNYATDFGAESIVMSTNNGGRTWWAQAYFAATDFFNFMHGGRIDISPITSVAGSYISGSLKMCRKRFNVPTDEVKEPLTPFVINNSDQALVTSFEVDSDGNALVNLASDVDYDGVFPIVYFENVSASDEWNYICNTGFSADGETNNGIFFRVEKVTPTQYKLFADLGNPYNGDAVCRHIHAVNSVESGILVSTGESYSENWYEGGFLYLLPQVARNGSNATTPQQNPGLIRLSSSINGVNRCAGAFMFITAGSPTLLYASDEAFVIKDNHKRYASIDGRTAKVPVTPGGIFIGKLSDIDDVTKFECVCPFQTTLIGLTENHGHFAADGHNNSVAFSKDGYKWNMDVQDKSQINGTDNYGNIYFGDKVVMFK